MAAVKKRRASSIVGKRIVKVEMCAHVEDNGHGGDRRTMHNPRITLEDGTKIVFMVEEHPMGAEYGVDLLVFR